MRNNCRLPTALTSRVILFYCPVNHCATLLKICGQMRLESSRFGETYNYPQLGHRIVYHWRSTTASDKLFANAVQNLRSDQRTH